MASDAIGAVDCKVHTDRSEGLYGKEGSEK